MKKRIVYGLCLLWLVWGCACSDDTRDYADGVECSIEGVLKYSETYDSWTIVQSDPGTIDSASTYIIIDYKVSLSQGETDSVEAAGIRLPYTEQTALPAGTNVYYFSVRSLTYN